MTAFSTHPFDKLIETQLTTKIFEKKKTYWNDKQLFIDLLWDIKDHKENCLRELSLYYNTQECWNFSWWDYNYTWNFFKKKKNGACVFWAPVFFLSLLAGKLNNFQTDVTEKQL